MGGMHYCMATRWDALSITLITGRRRAPEIEGIEIMARKFYIGSYAGSHTVYEIVQRGERAVSPRFLTRQEAETAITVLRSHQMLDAAA